MAPSATPPDSGPALTANDSFIVSKLFDPESSPNAAITIDPSLPPDRHITDSSLLSSLRQTEIQAINLAESVLSAFPAPSITSTPTSPAHRDEKLQEAVTLLTNLIESHPNYASAYNNRAQLLRLVSAPDAEVLSDLTTCINLAAPPRPTDAVSKSQAKLLSQAYTQRGTIYHTAAKRASGEEAETLSEKGSRDFFMGGRYGNEMARAMSVATNPYAKLCGGIVKEAMRREGVGK